RSGSELFGTENTVPIFKNINGRLAKIRLTSSFDESMTSDFESFTFLKSSTTSSGNESDYDYPPDIEALGSLKVTDAPAPIMTSTPSRNPFHSAALHPSEIKLEKSRSEEHTSELQSRFD